MLSADRLLRERARPLLAPNEPRHRWSDQEPRAQYYPFAGLPDVASRLARRGLLESERQGEVGSLNDEAKLGVS